MGEYLLYYILVSVGEGLAKGAEKAAEYYIRKVVDGAGRMVSEFFYSVDTDHDGIADDEVVFYTLDYQIPNLDGGYSLVADGDTVGLGLPQFRLIDGIDITSYVDTIDVFDLPTITGNGQAYLVDADGDSDADDVIVALDDLTGDCVPDFGLVLDADDNGIPDASPDAPFYEVGSDAYNQIIASMSNQPSIIMMSQDGTMTVYDKSGQITAEDCETAYSLWVSENGIMDKQLDNYTVTEGLLLCLLLMGGFYFVKSLFKRKDVYR